MASHPIKDRTLSKQGFSYFVSSSVARDGQSIRFEYPSGAEYEIPLAYLLTWYDSPHELRAPAVEEKELRIQRSRRNSDNQLVSVYLSDGRVYLVAYDTVLMASEPLYEHFGGLTEASRARTKDWWDSQGGVKRLDRSTDRGNPAQARVIPSLKALQATNGTREPSMIKSESKEAWVFNFFVESARNELVAYEVAEEFFDHILASAEQRGLQIGGTFRPPTDDENNLDVLSQLDESTDS